MYPWSKVHHRPPVMSQLLKLQLTSSVALNQTSARNRVHVLIPNLTPVSFTLFRLMLNHTDVPALEYFPFTLPSRSDPSPLPHQSQLASKGQPIYQDYPGEAVEQNPQPNSNHESGAQPGSASTTTRYKFVVKEKYVGVRWEILIPIGYASSRLSFFAFVLQQRNCSASLALFIICIGFTCYRRSRSRRLKRSLTLKKGVTWVSNPYSYIFQLLSCFTLSHDQ